MRTKPRALAATTALASVLTLLIPVASSARPAGPQTSRTLVEEYAGPAPGFYAGHQGSYLFYPDCKDRIGCVEVHPEPGDRFMRLTVKDEVTENPQYWVELVASGGRYHYCGGSSDVLPISGETRIWILLPQGTCADGSPATATRGEFTIELASSRKALNPTAGTAR